MPFIVPFLPMIFAGATAGAGIYKAVSGSGDNSGTSTATPGTGMGVDVAGRPIDDKAILPGVVNPTYPGLQTDWGAWLKTLVGKGATPYPGQLSPDVNQTRLPEVWNSWQPWDGGMGLVANTTAELNVGKNSPLTDQLMQWGGTGGAGHFLQKAVAQFGGPTPEATQPVANLAQWGVSSEGAGRPLADLAYGKLTGPAAFLLPFLTANATSGGGYRAPSVIPAKTITRTA